jgi:hypothetical protein
MKVSSITKWMLFPLAATAGLLAGMFMMGPAPRPLSLTDGVYGTGIITGRVTDTSSTPIAGECIIAVSRHGDEIQDLTGTRSDGSYLLQTVPTGSYRIFAYDNNMDCVDGNGFAPHYSPMVKVRNGAVTIQNMTIAHGGTINNQPPK